MDKHRTQVNEEPTYSFDINKRLANIGKPYQDLDFYRTTSESSESSESEPERRAMVPTTVTPETQLSGTTQLCPSCKETKIIPPDDYICLRCRNDNE